jgi:hypothetical protein
MCAHILAKKYDIKMEYGEYEKMTNLGIDLYSNGSNYYGHEMPPICITDSNFFHYISSESNILQNLIFADKYSDLEKPLYAQTKGFSMYLNDYFFKHHLFDQIFKSNPHVSRYKKNNDVYVHIRLGDASKYNPGYKYYDYVLSKIDFNQGYISSDSIDDTICQKLIKKHHLIIYDKGEVETLHFASTCKTLILSNGTYSWLMGFLAPFSQVYYPEIIHNWHGEIFVFNEWKKVLLRKTDQKALETECDNIMILDDTENDTEDKCSFVSSRGIMKSCDIFSYKPISSIRTLKNYDFRYLEDGGTVYVCSSAIPDFKTLISNIHSRFVLVSGDCDESLPTELFDTDEDFIKFIESDKIIHWYSQNCVGKHPKLTQIPIGLDYHTMSKQDHSWGPKTLPSNQELILNKIAESAIPFQNRIRKAYSNFHFSMNTKFAYDRRDAIKEIPCECVYYEPENVFRIKTWKNQADYAFVISPHGNGLDCHRTWEALCLGCIVIVKTSALDPLYDDLPVWVVNEWSDVSEETMEKKVKEYELIKFNYEKLTLQYWMNIISKNPLLH